jgi:amidohydrolase
VPGVMHACGHDANTTTVLGCAMLLAKRQSELKGNAKFIFQPSEEAPPGGAAPMIADGALENPDVDFIIGVHVDSTIPSGKIGLRDGHMMAAADDFTLTILGEAAHGAKPHLGIDAIQLQAHVVLALQPIVSRQIDPTHPVVLTLGTIHGGYRQNVIADRVDMEGTMRTLFPKDRKAAPKMIERIVSRVTDAFGGGYEFEYRLGYPGLTCDPVITDVVRRATKELFGKRSVVEIDTPSMGGEDFAYFVAKVPGMMFRLGTGNKQLGFTYPWHHPKFDIDEKGLWVGAAVMAGAGMRLLNGE